MAKNNEKFEEILDELHENKQAFESLKNEFNSFKKEILDKLPGNATAQSLNPQLAQETNNVTAKYSEPKKAVYDATDAKDSKFPTAVGFFTESDGQKIARICAKEYITAINASYKKRQEKDKTEYEEYQKKRHTQGIDTIEQVAEWASEYTPEVQRVMRFLGLRIINEDEPAETAHKLLKIWGNALSRVTNVPDSPPTLKAWMKYRWNKARNYANKKRMLYYYLILLLMLFSIGALSFYQNKVMRMDKTNQVWYKTYIQTRQDAEKWKGLDSILYKDNTIYDRP